MSVPWNVNVVESVPAKVRELLAVRVFPSATVRVAEVAGAVMATLLTEVADATPRVGVVRMGLVRVLLVKVCVVVVPTNVRSESGTVRTLVVPVVRPSTSKRMSLVSSELPVTMV